MNSKYLNIFRNSVVGLTAVFVTSVCAQTNYPSKPIRIVVPFGAATATDAMARVYAKKLEAQMGTPVLVENREGAGGLIGATTAADAAPDGYTILFSVHPPFAIAPLLQKQPPYDPVKSFSPIAQVVRLPLALVANKSAPFKTFQELISYAKANPGKVDYGSAGIGVPSHVYMEQIKQELDLDITFVPYKSTAQLTTDLLAGHIPLTLQTFGVAKAGLSTGQLTGLAIGSNQRNAAAPDVPTLSEVSGKRSLGANVSIWYGFFAPRDLPSEIVSRLYEEIAIATKSPELKSVFDNVSAEIALEGPEAFAKQIKDNYDQSRKLVDDLKLASN